MKILVTGGTGTLGREIVHQLLGHTYQVSVLSSQEKPLLPESVEVFKGDLATNVGLQEATENAETIIHCASSPKDAQKIDIEGLQNLLAAIDKNRIQHFIFISIVGIDKSVYPYYQAKNKAEKMISESGIPYSILRTTQFHNLVLNIIQQFVNNSNNRIIQIPQGMRFQSIDAKEVASLLVELVKTGPAGLLPEAGGPQVLTFEEMAHTYLRVFKRTDVLQPMPIKGERYDLFRSGINLCPRNVCGHVTWEEFLHHNLLFKKSKQRLYP